MSGSECLLFLDPQLAYDAVFYPSSLRTNRNPRARAVAATCVLSANGLGRAVGFENALELNYSYTVFLSMSYLFVCRLKDYFLLSLKKLNPLSFHVNLENLYDTF